MRIYFGSEKDVLIQDVDGAIVYNANGEEFDADAPAARPALPDGMVAMEYRPVEGVVVYYDRKQNAHPCEGRAEIPELDTLLARSDALATAQTVRADHALALVMDRVFNMNAAAALAPAARHEVFAMPAGPVVL